MDWADYSCCTRPPCLFLLFFSFFYFFFFFFFYNGRKILDTARGGLFSSCCELAWPLRLSGKGGNNGEQTDEADKRNRQQNLCRTASRSLPSSPASPRRHPGISSLVTSPATSAESQEKSKVCVYFLVQRVRSDTGHVNKV